MAYLKVFLRVHRWEILGFLLLSGCIFINRFPDGYILLGGDIIQPMNMAENFSFYYYDWHGRVSLYYGIFYLLDKLQVGESAQLSWFLGLFLMGAYFSFLAFASLIFPGSSRLVRVLGALFYATNLFTLYVFTASWGYTSYQILYVFIPALAGLYIRALQGTQKKYLPVFLLIIFFSSSSFGNPAFALSLGIYFLFLTVFVFLFRLVKPEREVLKRIFVLGAGTILVNAFWLLPLLPQVRSGVAEIATSTDIQLEESLRKTSNAIFDTIRLLPTSEQNRYFPVNFPYPVHGWLEPYIYILAFLPVLFILVGFLDKKNQEGREKELFGVFLALLVVLVALATRARYPFETMNNFLFQLPGLNTLRGYDKVATFIPFVVSVLLLLFLLGAERKKYSKVIFAGFLSATILLSLPFYAGGLQTKLSYILSGQKAKDFRTAKQSALIEIPETYWAAASLLETGVRDSKISMLPFSPGSSVGRVELPGLKVNGPHMAKALYSQSFLELSEFYIPGWKFAESFAEAPESPEWIADLFGLLGVQHVFYHKDAKPNSLAKMEAKRQRLEAEGLLHPLVENDSFILYRLDERRVFPYVFAVAGESKPLPLRPDGFSRAVEDLRAQTFHVSYSRPNPKKIIVSAETMAAGQEITLNEKYDRLWKAQYKATNGRPVSLTRNEKVTYANAWKISQAPSPGSSIVIYYLPLKLFWIGQGITGLALLVIFFRLSPRYKKRKL